jgi:4-diphosphocytidyl-2-C-methyl-D-erythritol kinase
MIGAYRSYAKINLHLQVIGRRSDGYHELRTLFQSVALHDRLLIERAEGGISVEVAAGEAPADRTNLAVRAAELYFARCPPAEGLRITLDKRIPAGGGLGGGSSNAATVLRALEDHYQRADRGALWRMARELGADVPFFLVGGTALGFGRGDEVVPLSDLPETEVWLVTPSVAVSTPEVFGRLTDLTAQPLPSSIVTLAQGEGVQSAAAVEGRNDLEELVLGSVPLLREVYGSLFGAGATVVRLSGTGASFFAFFDRDMSKGGLEAQVPKGTIVVRSRTLQRADSLKCGLSMGDWINGGNRDQGLPG